MPSITPKAPASAAAHQLASAANSSTGRGANHISGQKGSGPVPKNTSNAMASVAATPSPRRFTSSAYAIEISPERAPVERAELGGAHGHAVPEVEHDEAVGEGAHLEGDLPVVVLLQCAA